MLPGPIFAIDVLTTARRARYYALRAIYAFVLLVVLFMNYYDPYGRRTYNIHEVAAMAQSFFQAFAVVQVLVVACLAPALAAGTVALERERRTIEYLFATDLSNAEIVLGRLCSRLLLITGTVLVGLPILACAMLFGGIAVEQLLIAFALAMSTAVFVASLSMAISVSTPKARDAVLRCYAILLALWIVPPILGWLLGAWAPLQPLSVVTDLFEYLSPFQALMGTLFRARLDWSSIAGVLIAQSIAALVCTALAVGLVRRIHLRAAGAAARPVLSWLPATIVPRHRWAVSDRAMLWKEVVSPQSKVRFGFFGHLSLLLLTIIALGNCIHAVISAVQAAPYFNRDSYLGQTVPFSVLIACFGGLAISARAAASIAGERERQCWDSLISSPLEASEIVSAKICGCLYSARWLVALLCVMWGLGVFVDFSLFVPFLFGMATLLVVLLFGCCLGVYFSAGANSSLRAMGSTLGTLIFLGGGYLFCCVSLMMGGSSRDSEVVVALCIPFLMAFPFFAHDIRASGPEAGLYVAYVIGLSVYAIASFLLAAGTTGRIRPHEHLGLAMSERLSSVIPDVVEDPGS